MALIRILNLYAGIGGNRKLWGNDFDVTAVEMDKNIAEIYQSIFTSDKCLIEDAHEYLLNNYYKYDFIWSSPPCQSHSSFRFNINVRYRGTQPMYADMKLYQEILLLKTHFEGKWVVENVKPYYEPLIKPDINLGRHLFWTNYKVKAKTFDEAKIRKAQIPDLQKKLGFDLTKWKIKNKRQILRNCVEPKIGKYLLESAMVG